MFIQTLIAFVVFVIFDGDEDTSMLKICETDVGWFLKPQLSLNEIYYFCT